MADLAKELGMSKKTLYAHFSSKDALLQAMLLDKFSNVEADIIAATQDCTSDFSAALQCLLACLQKHTSEIQPAFVRDVQREAPELFQFIEGRRRELIQQHIGKLFEAGRKQGLIRRDIEVHLIIEILLGAVHAIVNPPKLAELGLTPSAAFSTIIQVVLQGILSPKARSDQ